VNPSYYTPGSFNAYDTATAAGAISGFIKTKIAGTTISVDVIALNSTKTSILTTFTGAVKVEILDASNNTGAIDAFGCRATWSVIQTLPNPTFAASDNGRKTVSFTQANAYRDVRVRISYPAAAPSTVGCSTDDFALRPDSFANFAFSDATWQTAGTTRALTDVTFGATMHKAGRPLSVRATAVNAAGTPATTSNYTGSPTATLSACAGAACTSSFGNLTLTTTFVAGQLVSDVASYDNVGSFQLQLVDSTFAAVDAADGSTSAERNIASAAINVGRFVPDHFAISLNTPAFGTACGAFTYVGQRFNYATAPVITVTAQDFANNTTTLYTGNWWRITGTSLTAKAYAAAIGTLDTSGLPATDPAIAATGAGQGTLTFGSGSGLLFNRGTPAAPYNAEIGLSINVIDADGIAYAGNPASFGAASAGNGIAFNSGKTLRFGRLRLTHANGSQLVSMPIRMETQYWNGAAFTTAADTCTTVAAANISLGNYLRNLSAGQTTVTSVGAFSGGIAWLRLSAPGAAHNGSVDVAVNLTGGAATASCSAGMASSTGTAQQHLQGAWCGGAYGNDPTARATFGTYRNSDGFIYMRELF
jgi:MSHA biogenesis protein MshQ